MDEKEEKVKQEFLNCVEQFKKCDKTFDDDTKLKLYGYYKQAMFGDCNISCPSFLYFKEKAKWDAWEQHKGMKKQHAMKKYVKLSNELLK
jgi:diazepam-binding inhibitor (GABA receptor modulating acyl-CoA-binding protein)